MIRRAEKKDMARLDELLYQVQRVHAEGRPDIFKLGEKKYTDAELEAILADDEKPVFVSEQEGVIRGYAFCVYQTQPETNQVHARKTLYIDDLCVDEKARGQHVGTELYRYVVQTAEAAGCDSVTLNVWALNEGARWFYDRMGLTPLKTTMEKVLGADRQKP